MLRLYEESGCHVLPYHLDKIYNRQALHTARALLRFLHEKSIDLVQTFHFGSDTFGALTSRLAKVPLLISGRRDLGSYRTGRFKLVDRAIQPLFHHYISVCDAVSATLLADGVAREKITVIPNGVDLAQWPAPSERARSAAREQLGVEADAFVIGNLSHFRPEKGHTTFFAALRKVSPHIRTLKVFALGSGKHRIEPLLQQDAMLKKIVTLDKVADVRAYLPAFDLACLTPTMNEGFSNALLEEMAAGLPVIATDVGGNREAIIAGESGFIVPPGDADAIATKILALYHNPTLRQAMGVKARKRVEEHFSLDRMVARMEALYQNLFEQHRRNGSKQRRSGKNN